MTPMMLTTDHVSELEVSAVCSVNNNNEMDALEKRRSFADMKMVNVTNSNYHNSQVICNEMWTL